MKAPQQNAAGHAWALGLGNLGVKGLGLGAWGLGNLGVQGLGFGGVLGFRVS